MKTYRFNMHFCLLFMLVEGTFQIQRDFTWESPSSRDIYQWGYRVINTLFVFVETNTSILEHDALDVCACSLSVAAWHLLGCRA